MADINVTLSAISTDINITLSGDFSRIYARKTFVGDGSGNQVISLDGVISGDSELVYFSGVLGERDIDYTISAGKDQITIIKTWATGRKGEIRYVKN